jgi:glutamine amidotransferase
VKRVAILDYGMGNLDSVSRAFEECGASPFATNSARDLRDASYLVLPGVGAFADGMRRIRELGLEDGINEQVERGIPLLGLCLGMQLLADHGVEGGESTGLGLIPGNVLRLVPDDPTTRIPHVGWNEVNTTRSAPLFDGIEDGKDFYFVHSFHFDCLDESAVLARTPYCGGFVSVVQRENVTGVQFHPEKSQKAGFQLIKSFLAQ